jgi:hypothetical protein
VEQEYPEFIPHLSSCKSPQQVGPGRQFGGGGARGAACPPAGWAGGQGAGALWPAAVDEPLGRGPLPLCSAAPPALGSPTESPTRGPLLAPPPQMLGAIVKEIWAPRAGLKVRRPGGNAAPLQPACALPPAARAQSRAVVTQPRQPRRQTLHPAPPKPHPPKQPEDVAVVSVMPCTAKKGEAARPEMRVGGGGHRGGAGGGAADDAAEGGGEGIGGRHVDYVLTTRELGRMMRRGGAGGRRAPARPPGRACSFLLSGAAALPWPAERRSQQIKSNTFQTNTCKRSFAYLPPPQAQGHYRHAALRALRLAHGGGHRRGGAVRQQRRRDRGGGGSRFSPSNRWDSRPKRHPWGSGWMTGGDSGWFLPWTASPHAGLPLPRLRTASPRSGLSLSSPLASPCRTWSLRR